MALGNSDKQRRFDDPSSVLGDRPPPGSLYRLLSDEGDRLFDAEYFAESPKGRPTIPARVPASVMLLQSFEEQSDPDLLDVLDDVGVPTTPRIRSFQTEWARRMSGES